MAVKFQSIKQDYFIQIHLFRERGGIIRIKIPANLMGKQSKQKVQPLEVTKVLVLRATIIFSSREMLLNTKLFPYFTLILFQTLKMI